VAAMRDEVLAEAPPSSRRRRVVTALVGIAGLALLVQGLVGNGPASSRISAMGLGSLLVFVGVALSARYVVRPLAAVVGWPLRRLGHATGELARDNATRNPARTAVTAAALMVGLALVVFVSVFAAGLKDSINGAIDDRAKAELVVTSDTMAPLSRAAGPRIDRVPSVVATAPQYLDQVQVNGRKVNAVTDQLTGIDPLALRDAYSFRWLHGSDADLQRVVGTAAIIEEQFAKAHGITVGERFRVTGATGHSATLTAIAEYRDPQLMQGLMVDVAQFRALSSLRDPLAYFVTLVPGADTAASQREVKAALADFPSAKVRTGEEYSDYIGGQLDQLVYLLYALLAMSIVISMFGIANSLFLSIHERTRELGMLRAIGATAAQVRRMIRYESVITSLIGGVLGTGVGILFAWLTTFAVKDLGVGFSIPAGQLVVFLVLAVVVGVLGAVAPARRAARLQILDAVRSE
jgi:putative ABC transport system permease protein